VLSVHTGCIDCILLYSTLVWWLVVHPWRGQALRSMRAQMDVLVNEAAHKGERLDKLEEEIVGVTFPTWFQPKPKMPVREHPTVPCLALCYTTIHCTITLRRLSHNTCSKQGQSML